MALGRRLAPNARLSRSLERRGRSVHRAGGRAGGSTHHVCAEYCVGHALIRIIDTLTCIIGTLNSTIDTLTCIIGTVNSIIDTLTCIIGTLNSIIGTLTCIIGTLNSTIDTRRAGGLADAPCMRRVLRRARSG